MQFDRERQRDLVCVTGQGNVTGLIRQSEEKVKERRRGKIVISCQILPEDHIQLFPAPVQLY